MSSPDDTEVWLRNPKLVINQANELNLHDFVWDAGFLLKHKMLIQTWTRTYLSPLTPWRQFVIFSGNIPRTDKSYAIEYTPQNIDTEDRPEYPVWQWGESWKSLVQKVEAKKWATDEKRIFICNMPHAQHQAHAYLQISELQEEYPDVIFHLHGSTSFGMMFGLSFRSVDIEARLRAATGQVSYPTGAIRHHSKVYADDPWILLMNTDPAELHQASVRCIHNIKTALWAAKNYKSEVNFKRPQRSVAQSALHAMIESADLPDDEYVLPQTNRINLHNKRDPQAGDKFLCDMCSLSDTCRYYRERAVCIVPDSEPTELARFFKSRDSGVIIDGLGVLMQTQTSRLRAGLERENDKEKLDPEVTKIIKNLFDNGVKLAKLVDPSLAAAAAPKFQLNQQFNQNGTLVAANPQELASQIVSQMEARGIPRNKITPEMVHQLMETPVEERQQIIEAKAIGGD